MGLDMYAFATRTAPATPVDFSAEESQELAYWRKHPNLHGCMEHLYRAKGGKAEDFNCVNLQLDAADLDALEHAVRSKPLPPTVGFFFGQTDGSDKASSAPAGGASFLSPVIAVSPMEDTRDDEALRARNGARTDGTFGALRASFFGRVYPPGASVSLASSPQIWGRFDGGPYLSQGARD